MATTGEVGVFHVTTETSSASNVRRIEALTGSEATRLFQERTQRLDELARLLRVPEHEVVHAVERLNERVKELQKKPRQGAGRAAADELVGAAEEVSGVRVVVQAVEGMDAKELLDLSDAVRQKLGESAVVLGCAVDGRVHLVANVAPPVVERGVKAGDVIRAAAKVAGGGGGGRDTMAQAGGREPEKLPDALATARGSRSKRRSAECACSRSTTARRAAAARSRTHPARSPRRCRRSSGRTRRRGSRRLPGWRMKRAPSASSSVSRSPCRRGGRAGGALCERLQSGSNGESPYRWSFTTSA